MSVTEPLVSVIIPTYNDTEYLHSAVRSVLCQTYENIEVIVVDDYSDENVKDVVDAIDDGRTTYIRHDENRGGSAARNTGIEHSAGEYLAFLDADDVWLPNKLRQQIPLLASTDSNTGILLSSFLKLNLDRCSAEIVDPVPSNRAPGCPSRWLVKKHAVDSIGGFDEELLSMQDNDFSVRLLSKFKAIYDTDPVAIYQERLDSVSHDPEKTIPGRKRFLEKNAQKLTADERSGCYYYLARSLLEIEEYDAARRYVIDAINSQWNCGRNYVLLASALFKTSLIYKLFHKNKNE